MGKLRVAINAQLLPDGPSGGIVTVLRALSALTELEDGAEEYVFVGPYGDPEWMRPVLPMGQRIVRGLKSMSPDADRVDLLEPFKRGLGPLRPIARDIKQMLVRQRPTTLAADAGRKVSDTSSRSFFQSLECDVVHFPFQSYELCDVPTVYNPHDLQHFHFREFFTPAELARRDHLYPAACRAANTVVVASQFVKLDLIERYGIDAKKVQVIPWAPPPLPKHLREVEDSTIRTITAKYAPGARPFVLYPAMTWEHKNHIRFLEAVAFLRDTRALNVQVICTGFKTDFWASIERRLHELNLSDTVKFTGLIPLDELNALYGMAQCVFVPTLFEAASAPVFEAWQHGVPVACSTVTSLPEQVADGALLFDPFAVKDIASALERMVTDSALRDDLRRRGTRRLNDFSLERTAKTYRAVYRRAAGRKLNQEDLQLLAGDRRAEPRRLGSVA